MCGLYGEGGKLPAAKEELSLEEIKTVIDDLKHSYKHLPYKPYIGFMGGEPFIYPHIFEAFEYLKKNGFKYAVTTNLTLLNNEKIERLLNVGVNDLRISLDGPEEIHDKIRNVPRTFRKVMANLRTIKEDKRGKEIPVRFNCAICPDNIDFLKEMPAIAQEFKADLSFQHLTFIDEKHHKENSIFTKKVLDQELHMDLTTLRLSKSEVERIKLNINEVLNRADELGVRVTFTPDLKIEEFDDYYFNLDNYTHNNYCNWPWGSARILPYGDVTSCMHYMFGNIRNESFEKIWNGQRARKFRKTLKKSKLFPGCVRCCKI